MLARLLRLFTPPRAPLVLVMLSRSCHRCINYALLSPLTVRNPSSAGGKGGGSKSTGGAAGVLVLAAPPALSPPRSGPMTTPAQPGPGQVCVCPGCCCWVPGSRHPTVRAWAAGAAS